MQHSHSELVEIAKARLVDLGALVGRVDLPALERRVADLLEHLEELCQEFDHDKPPHSGQGQSLSSVDLANAWRRGLAPDGASALPSHAYLEKLEELGSRCSADPAAFDALAFHAAARIAEDQRLSVPLRRFVCDHLGGKLMRPRPPGRTRKTVLSDLMLAQVVAELVEKHGIKAVGNVASENEGSACAIVAQAMKELGQPPRSFSAVEKAWFASRRGKRD